MALVHEFEKTGNWLFRRRSWLPLALVISGFIVMYYVNRLGILYDSRKELIFLGISLFGEVIRILTVGFAPGNTSGRNTNIGQLADEINTRGVYSLVRHPLYVGNFFTWLGPALFLRSAWFAIVFALVYWIYYERIMFAEEQFLRSKFGDIYDKWSETVGAVIPKFRNFKRPGISFSFRVVLGREYNSIANIFLIFASLDVARNYIVTGRVFMNGMWIWCLGGAAMLWLAVRLIQKFTRWLYVEGR